MITYAQHFEDIMLARLFQGRKDGFYIDVGAGHPDVASVTRYFYDLGWRGINIEPIPAMHQLLVERRPHDINLCLAAGDKCENRVFYESPSFVFSSFDPLQANAGKAYPTGDGRGSSYFVEVDTLSNICRKYCDRPIDFLKVDAEGFECEVLLGMDFMQYKPAVLIIEAKKGGVAVDFTNWDENLTVDRWEYILLEHGYERVYFDWANCFYVQKDDEVRKKCFSLPIGPYEFTYPRYSAKDLVDYKSVLSSNHRTLTTLALESEQMRKERDENALQLSTIRNEYDATFDLQREIIEQQRCVMIEQGESIARLRGEVARSKDENAQQLLAIRSECDASLGLQREIVEQQRGVMTEQGESIARLREGVARSKIEADERLRQLESSKSKEYTELDKSKSLMIERLSNDVDSLNQKVSEQDELVDYLQGKLAWNRGEVKRLRTAFDAARHQILELDEKARGLIMAMHARAARAPWWLRPFLPKWALPSIGEPLKLKAMTPPKAAGGDGASKNTKLDVRSTPQRQPAPSMPQTSPQVRLPGSFDRYPDRTGHRLIEGGRRLKGEKRASRPNEPLVTIITTVRNGEKHLEQAMGSVFAQTWRNIEYIIIDGASTDGTLKLIKRYEEKIDYFISEPDTGIYAGMNKGIELARGDYILILNSDDYLVSPDAVTLLVEQSRNGEIEAVLGGAKRLDANDQHVGAMRSTVDARLFLRCTVVHEAMLASRELYRRFGLYDESFKVAADWAWMRRVLPRVRCRIVDEDILAHRSIGISAKDDIETAREKYRILAPDVPGLSWENYYPARYPHHLTRAESDALAAKYPNCTVFVEALALFPEGKSNGKAMISSDDLALDKTNNVPENGSFDPISYWKKRHNDFRSDSRAVGAIMLSKQENDCIYDNFNQWLSEFLHQLFPSVNGSAYRVLDVGCGTGMNAPVFLKNGWEYCGVDISDTAIEQARVRAPAGEYRIHDLSSSSLPEWEERFDCIFIRTVLIHVVDDERWRALLTHATRLLNETGKVVIIDDFPEQRQSPAQHVVVRSLDEYRTVAELLHMSLKVHTKNSGKCIVLSRLAKSGK